MLTLASALPMRLLKRAQSARISLPKRLRALSEMAQRLDQSVTVAAKPISIGQLQANSPAIMADRVEVGALLEEATQLVHGQLLPRIRRYHVQIVAVDQLTEAQHIWLRHYFQQQIYPLLTPLAVDSGHPFPYLQSRRLNFLVVLQANAQQGRSAERYGVLQIPARLPRLIQIQPCILSRAAGNRTRPLHCLVWYEEVVRYFLPLLFSGLTVGVAYQFRLLRATGDGNSTPLPAGDLTPMGQRQGLPQAPIMRLDIEKSMPPHLRAWLINHLRVKEECVLDCATPLGLADLCELADYLTPR